MSRNDLTDTQWRKLEPHSPPNPKRGHALKDHRTVINGILWQRRTGAPWRDVPERYGPWRSLHDRLTRWERDGTWVRVLQALQAHADAVGDIDWDGAALDSTHVKAHRSATGARHEPAKLEKRGGSRMSGSGARGAG